MIGELSAAGTVKRIHKGKPASKETLSEYCEIYKDIGSSEYIRSYCIQKYWTGLEVSDENSIKCKYTPNELTIGSTVKLLWVCKNNVSHKWVKSPYEMLRSNSSCQCPYCVTGKAIEGLTDVHSRLMYFISNTENETLRRYGVYIASHIKAIGIKTKNIYNSKKTIDDMLYQYYNMYKTDGENGQSFYNYLESHIVCDNEQIQIGQIDLKMVPYNSKNTYIILECDKNHLSVHRVNKLFEILSDDDIEINRRYKEVVNGCKFCNTLWNYINSKECKESGYGEILFKQFTGIDSRGGVYKITDERLITTSGKEMLWQCLVNKDHKWISPIHSRTRRISPLPVSLSTGCPYCKHSQSNPNHIKSNK